MIFFRPIKTSLRLKHLVYHVLNFILQSSGSILMAMSNLVLFLFFFKVMQECIIHDAK